LQECKYFHTLQQKYMKVPILIALFSVLSTSTFAQVPDHALGVRFGGTVNAWGAEGSYQIGVSDETRLELDLGFGVNTGLTVVKITGGFHFTGALGGDFNWFGGPVAATGMYLLNIAGKEGETFEPFLHIGAVLGIDYFFHDFPLQISVDFRPEYPIGDSYADGDLDTGLGLGVRYIIEW
jgi:hypothetical protein